MKGDESLDSRFEKFIGYLKSLKCTKHQLPIAHICTNCQEIICFKCGMDHKNHTAAFIGLDSDIASLKMNFMGCEKYESTLLNELNKHIELVSTKNHLKKTVDHRQSPFGDPQNPGGYFPQHKSQSQKLNPRLFFRFLR